ncbi:MAG: hypothetical protein J6N54_10845 [Bacteroidales bacterium]|nr:hypothetical protein [Bacteroidales bacterium]
MNLSNTAVWQFIRRVVDSRFLSGKAPEDASVQAGGNQDEIDPRIG